MPSHRAQRIELLNRLWHEGRDFDATQSDRRDRRRNIEPESGEFLNILLRTLAPGRVLELGTSTGYSTIWLADALEPTGGELVTVENDPGRASEAAENLAAAQVATAVRQVVGDAGVFLREASGSHWPVILLDAERSEYVSYWPDLLRTVEPGGLIVVDNCLSHADQVADFRALVSAEPSCLSTLVPIGAGLLLITRNRESPASTEAPAGREKMPAGM